MCRIWVMCEISHQMHIYVFVRRKDWHCSLYFPKTEIITSIILDWLQSIASCSTTPVHVLTSEGPTFDPNQVGNV